MEDQEDVDAAAEKEVEDTWEEIEAVAEEDVAENVEDTVDVVAAEASEATEEVDNSFVTVVTDDDPLSNEIIDA